MADNVRHPTPLNQFWVLEYNEVTKTWVKVRRWNHTHADENGVVINWDSKLCMATEGAVALDAHTGGRRRSTPGAIHDRQNDQSGGIGIDDVKVAWDSLGEDLIYPDGFDWADVVAAIRARRHVLYAVDYSKLPYADQIQKVGMTFFPHALGLDDVNASGQVLVYDSLGTGPKWMNPAGLQAAGEAIALRERGSKGRLFVGLTAIRPKLNAPAPTYSVTIIQPTSLWNETTKRWVFNGTNRLTEARVPGMTVRGAGYVKSGVLCYPVNGPTTYGAGNYFVPKVNVQLGARIP